MFWNNQLLNLNPTQSDHDWAWVKEFRSEAAAKRELKRWRKIDSSKKLRVRKVARGVWVLEEFMYVGNLPRRGRWISAAEEARIKSGR